MLIYMQSRSKMISDLKFQGRADEIFGYNFGILLPLTSIKEALLV